MKLFVYGSLKRGFSNHHFLTGQIFLGVAATVAHGRMFDCGGFPGVIPCSTGAGYPIQGELWQIDQPHLEDIDCLEEVAGGVYQRATWEVLLAEEQTAAAFLYVYLLQTETLKEAGPAWTADRDLMSPSPLPREKDQE